MARSGKKLNSKQARLVRRANERKEREEIQKGNSQTPVVGQKQDADAILVRDANPIQDEGGSRGSLKSKNYPQTLAQFLSAVPVLATVEDLAAFEKLVAQSMPDIGLFGTRDLDIEKFDHEIDLATAEIRSAALEQTEIDLELQQLKARTRELKKKFDAAGKRSREASGRIMAAEAERNAVQQKIAARQTANPMVQQSLPESDDCVRASVPHEMNLSMDSQTASELERQVDIQSHAERMVDRTSFPLTDCVSVSHEMQVRNNPSVVCTSGVAAPVEMALRHEIAQLRRDQLCLQERLGSLSQMCEQLMTVVENITHLLTMKSGLSLEASTSMEVEDAPDGKREEELPEMSARVKSRDRAAA